MRLLLEKGAELEATSILGMTPLSYAAKARSEPVVRAAAREWC